MNSGNVCKHIQFILLRVMKISSEKVKSSWTNTELTKMFTNIPKYIDKELVVDDDAIIKYEAYFKEKSLLNKKWMIYVLYVLMIWIRQIH